MTIFNLNSKYFVGFGILGVIGVFSFFVYELSINLFPYALILLGITTLIVGMVFIRFLFIPERIKGYQAEYEASPDLSRFEVIKMYPSSSPLKSKLPEVAYCSACGKKVYKPFQCSKCGQILCGQHYLSGDHICKEEV